MHSDLSIGYLINLLARLYTRSIDSRLYAYGLSHGQLPALMELWEKPGLTQTEIAKRVAVEQPTMANTVARMERDGWIERQADPVDRRRTLLFPTPRAMELQSRILAEVAQVNSKFAGGLSDADRHQVMYVLHKMVDNLDGVNA